MYLFADDTKLFKGIYSSKDCDDLQTDIDSMLEWSEKSLMFFHPDKCGVMKIWDKNKINREYNLGLTKLRTITEEKDIGVIIDNSLKFESHMSTKINKANAIMGMIRRAYVYLDQESFLLLYKTLVRPHLEYANQVWAPHLKKDIVSIENVQRRATKLIPGFKDLSYQERLQKLKLPTLTYRRTRGDVIEMYKILTGKYDPLVSDFIKINTNQTRGHPYKIQKQHIKQNVRKYSFVHRCANVWNSLPIEVVTAPNVKVFERRLDRLWIGEPVRFDFEAGVPGTTTRTVSARTTHSSSDTELTPEAS